MRIRVFVSHATKDEALATGPVDVVLSTMVLEGGELRCTSVPGHKLPVGSDTSATLRDELDGTWVN